MLSRAFGRSAQWDAGPRGRGLNPPASQSGASPANRLHKEQVGTRELVLVRCSDSLHPRPSAQRVPLCKVPDTHSRSVGTATGFSTVTFCCGRGEQEGPQIEGGCGELSPPGSRGVHMNSDQQERLQGLERTPPAPPLPGTPGKDRGWRQGPGGQDLSRWHPCWPVSHPSSVRWLWGGASFPESLDTNPAFFTPPHTQSCIQNSVYG